MILLETITPAELSDQLGWSEKRVRSLAKRLGACRVLGNRMVFLPKDVQQIKAAIGTEAIKKSRIRLHIQHPSFVYFLAVPGFIKIGWSENWKSRLANVQTSNPEKIKVLLVLSRPKSFEAELHDLFAPHSARGEWFIDHPDIRSFIRAHRSECRRRL